MIVLVVGIDAATLEQRIGILGIEPDRVGKVSKRLVGVAFAAPHDGTLAVGGGKIRIDPNGFAVIGKRMIVDRPSAYIRSRDNRSPRQIWG